LRIHGAVFFTLPGGPVEFHPFRYGSSLGQRHEFSSAAARLRLSDTGIRWRFVPAPLNAIALE